jgi:hypothetical protein
MKILIRPAQSLPRLISNPLNAAALPLFFALAFLPALLHLTGHDFLAANLPVAAGPLAAGFWLAAGIREIRVRFALLGPLIAIILWSVNWLMTAGGGCCSTLGN